MKSSTNKTAGRSQASSSKSDSKSPRSNATASGSSSGSRGTACSKPTATARTSRSNNPEGHNQYTKKTGDSK